MFPPVFGHESRQIDTRRDAESLEGFVQSPRTSFLAQLFSADEPSFPLTRADDIYSGILTSRELPSVSASVCSGKLNRGTNEREAGLCQREAAARYMHERLRACHEALKIWEMGVLEREREVMEKERKILETNTIESGNFGHLLKRSREVFEYLEEHLQCSSEVEARGKDSCLAQDSASVAQPRDSSHYHAAGAAEADMGRRNDLPRGIEPGWHCVRAPGLAATCRGLLAQATADGFGGSGRGDSGLGRLGGDSGSAVGLKVPVRWTSEGVSASAARRPDELASTRQPDGEAASAPEEGMLEICTAEGCFLSEEACLIRVFDGVSVRAQHMGSTWAQRVRVRAHHIGSTAVANALCRPFLDVLLTYQAPVHVDGGDMLRFAACVIRPRLAGMGYVEADGDEGVFFRGLGGGLLKGVLLYVREETHPSVAGFLGFRDSLRGDAGLVEQYNELKMVLARDASTASEYLQAKREFFAKHDGRQSMMEGKA